MTRAWKAAGVSLPRTTWGLVRAGTATTRAQLVPGDLVIANGGGHVQLYIGHGKVIHAPRPGAAVSTEVVYLKTDDGAFDDRQVSFGVVGPGRAPDQ
ncbi:C40 family peptidase [Streptomyces sp. Wh19]|uniref:C40 family peptidase n=1 Tax=Streptomyces sp. Wh19 TaxID=3076629 RepID=UPI002958B129|nr:NlpC/P60 family protein [Streptomyces sp. Wh19]MDV9198346.1 NlpC/P60 family protein [Streptomyces sp. Wh19]